MSPHEKFPVFPKSVREAGESAPEGIGNFASSERKKLNPYESDTKKKKILRALLAITLGSITLLTSVEAKAGPLGHFGSMFSGELHRQIMEEGLKHLDPDIKNRIERIDIEKEKEKRRASDDNKESTANEAEKSTEKPAVNENNQK